jgi:hypothetical protein
MTDTLTDPLVDPDKWTPPTPADAHEAAHRRSQFDSDEVYAERLSQARDRDLATWSALRLLLDIVADHDLPMPHVGPAYTPTARIRGTWFVDDLEAARVLRRAIATPIGDRWEKSTDDGSLRLTLTGSGLALAIAIYGQTCERVKVGTKVETVTKVVEPAQTLEVEEEVDVYEWRCPDLNDDALEQLEQEDAR